MAHTEFSIESLDAIDLDNLQFLNVSKNQIHKKKEPSFSEDLKMILEYF